MSKYDGYDWIEVEQAEAEEACVASMHAPMQFVVSEDHHIEETTFLIEEVRKLASELAVTEAAHELDVAACELNLAACELEIKQLKARLAKTRSQDEARQRAANQQARWDYDHIEYQEDDHER